MADNEPQAIRLTFAYHGDKIELKDAFRITMFVPASDPLDAQPPSSGFWLELRASDERTLFRRLMHDPIGHDREIFPEQPGGEIFRRPVARPEGVFSVVVPEIKDAETLTLHGSTAGAPERYHAAAHEIARIGMDRLYMAWKGIFADQAIYFTTLDATGIWAPQAHVPNVRSAGKRDCARR